MGWDSLINFKSIFVDSFSFFSLLNPHARNGCCSHDFCLYIQTTAYMLPHSIDMALMLKLFLFTLLSAWSLRSMASARYMDKSFSLAARLHADDDSSSKCWESLLELQACTGEVVLFFLNSETHLGAGCCQAIQTIEHQCWPAMLTSIGFTAEEGDILQGYCDATTSSSAPPPPPPPPPPPSMEPNDVVTLGGFFLDP